MLCECYWMIRGHGVYVTAVRQIRESCDIERYEDNDRGSGTKAEGSTVGVVSPFG
jgi:hypothetical protein